jgi:hypothetical protein
MVMSSTHPQDVSDDELAIIRKFGNRYCRTHESIMTIGELLPENQHRQREVIVKLMDRGWLVTSAPVHWDRQSDCILLGEGLRIARRLAGDDENPDQLRQNDAWNSAALNVQMKNTHRPMR